MNWKTANQLNSFGHNDVKSVRGICEVCVGEGEGGFIVTFPLLTLVSVTWGLLLSPRVLNRHITPSDPWVSESIHRSVYNTIITRGLDYCPILLMEQW